MKTLLFVSFLLLIGGDVTALQAQDSLGAKARNPIVAEEFIGDKRQYFFLMGNATIAQAGRIGLLSISSYAAGYDPHIAESEYQNTTLIYHPIYGGLGINSGTRFTSVEGMRNFVGLQYAYQDTTLSLLYLPGYSWTASPMLSNFAHVEYKPALSATWSLYSRVQLQYQFDLEHSTHFRSFVYSRVGLSISYFSFGLAHNYDSYGAAKTTKNNYGVFLQLAL